MAQREALQRSLASIDVSDPHLYQDDTWRPLFAQLRRDDPVHYCEASPFGPYWSVTRYDDIFTVELDHENYSSSSELGGIQVADQPKGQEFANFIRMDPPGHTGHRRTVAPIVAPSNLVNLEPLIRKRTSDVLDALPRNETFDWVARVSTDLTNMMLATLFDFPWEDRMKLTWWSDVAIANVDAPDAVVHSAEERATELGKMGEYFRKLWDVRANAAPTFDLVSMLAHSEATRNLQAREFIGTIALLIVGGNDTTRNSMSGGLMALVENPEQFELVRARRELIPNLVAESIRYHSPVLHMRRTARNDVELAGRRIAKGDKVGCGTSPATATRTRSIARMNSSSIAPNPGRILRSAPASTAASATGLPSSKSAFSGRKYCNGISGSKSWGRRSGSVRISSAAFARCR